MWFLCKGDSGVQPLDILIPLRVGQWATCHPKHVPHKKFGGHPSVVHRVGYNLGLGPPLTQQEISE